MVFANHSCPFFRVHFNLIPDLIPPASPRIGIWGIRRSNHLRKHRNGIYTGLLLSGKLNAHLEETDRSANEIYELLIRQYAEREGAPQKTLHNALTRCVVQT